MALAFDGIQPVVQMARPTWPQGCGYRRLLWPVWVRRVAAPHRPSTELGPFERAVLGCARAKISDPQHIGSLLCIDPKLVQVIQSALRQHEVIDEAGEITNDGLTALGEGEIEQTTIKVVYVFQCALTGRLIPRVSENLRYEAVIRADRKATFIEAGTVAEPQEQRYLTIRPVDAKQPAIPDAVSVLRAIRHHFTAQRSEGFRLDEAEAIDSEQFAYRPASLKRVTVIDLKATAMFMVTAAHDLPLREGGRESEWCVCDPFGFSVCPLLARALREVRLSDRQVDEEFRPKPPKLVAMTSASEGAVNPDEIRRMAVTQVAEQLDPALSCICGYERLIDMAESLLWHDRATTSGGNIGQQKRHLRQCAIAGRQAIEACFVELSSRYPLAPLLSRMGRLDNSPSDVRYLGQVLEGKAQKLGLILPNPRRFNTVKPNDMRAVIGAGHHYKLAALIMANLAMAAESDGHPLAPTAMARPRLLHDLDQVLETGGQAAHHSAGPELLAERVLEMVDIVYWLWLTTLTRNLPTSIGR